MFGLFKKKETGAAITDKVTISEAAKWKALFSAWENNKELVIVFWFPESVATAEAFFLSKTNEPVTLLTSREAGSAHLQGKQLVFAEHHPLKSREDELFAKLNLSTVMVWSSLDEPLFQHFGGERIIDMMKKMGVGEDEVIEHKMISSSITNAQKKIGNTVTVEQLANSQREWMNKNCSL
jgi:hypothetical protein